jgi:hypothetical protein
MSKIQLLQLLRKRFPFFFFFLSHHNLDVQNIRGQGNNGVSNIHEEWNGLKALFINDCPYTYYVHCLAY